ncbi:hypothetical protein ACIQUB_22735 [Rhizobium sp. NPDC090275]|uniref:hypothetical protein n=1 Tax=Rhizobium sp. NPDC090275 TaxID=3364498 RepID=UPI00383A2AF8
MPTKQNSQKPSIEDLADKYGPIAIKAVAAAVPFVGVKKLESATAGTSIPAVLRQHD